MLVFVADGTRVGVDAGVGDETVVAVAAGVKVTVDVGEEVGGEDTVGVEGTGVGTGEGVRKESAGVEVSI